MAETLIGKFLREQYESDPNKTYRYWAERWRVSYSAVAKWAAGYRPVSRASHRIFKDLPFSLDEYYSHPSTPRISTGKRRPHRGR
jgi:hypothetical protein